MSSSAQSSEARHDLATATNSGASLRHLPYLHPDHPLEAALRRVYQVPLVPVVHRADFRLLEGVVSREDVLVKYKMEEQEGD